MHAISERIVVLADDLTGAAEAAGQLLPAAVHLTTSLHPAQPHAVLSVDLNTRHNSPEEAARRVTQAIALLGTDVRIFKKVDSLLRGNISSELEALLKAGRRLVVAPSLPSQQRTVVEGEFLIGGRPATQSDLWAAEPSLPPQRVEDVLPAASVSVSLGSVRGRKEALVELLASIGERGLIASCDCESASDLESVASAAECLPSNTCLVGSAALLDAMKIPRDRVEGPPVVMRGPVTFVIGSFSEAARQQVAALRSSPVSELVLTTTDSQGGIVSSTAIGTVVRSNIDRLRSSGVLVLSGGETARAVIDALDITDLTVVAHLGDGVVQSRDESGRTIFTKPGAHGDTQTLVSLARTIREATEASTTIEREG
jgi:uncharacterized protein YgbK (DUF1537 family)